MFPPFFVGGWGGDRAITIRKQRIENSKNSKPDPGVEFSADGIDIHAEQPLHVPLESGCDD